MSGRAKIGYAILLIAAIAGLVWWMKNKGVVKTWADAIQSFEGWKPGSKSYRNNNPGNLRVRGDLGVDAGGFGKFSTYELGRAALEADLSAKLRKYPTLTVLQIMTRYAPPTDNNPTQAYATFVANALGVSINTQLKDLG